MFTRLKQNVKTFPRAAAVMGTFYIGVVIGSYATGHILGISTGRQILTILSALALIVLVEGISYVWFMSNPRRVAMLLEILNSFEGRMSADDLNEMRLDQEDDADSEDDVCSGCEECDPGYLYASNGREKPTCGGNLIDDEEAQDIAEYAVMMAVILVIVYGVIQLIGGGAGNAINSAASKIAGQ